MKSDREKQIVRDLNAKLKTRDGSKAFWHAVQDSEGKIAFDNTEALTVSGKGMPEIERDISLTMPVYFVGCTFKGVNFDTPHVLVFHDCRLEKCALPRVPYLSQCRVKDSRLAGHVENIIDSIFTDCTFLRSPSTSIRTLMYGGACNFGRTVGKHFEQTDFQNVTFNAETQFENCTFTSCEMSRTAFFSLKNDGGLTAKNLNGIKITDPFIDIRKSLSGFNRWLNWAAILWFFLPYAAFIARRWTVHLLEPNRGETTLFEQLAKYIVSGGRTYTEWDFSFYKLAIFILFLAYNLCRLTLLKIVLDHETAEQVEGRPKLLKPRDHWWWWMPEFVKRCFWFAVVLALVNTILFGLVKIPE